MDKAEYISKLEQINALQEAGSYQEAAEIADSIDWKHVKSVRTLCMVGEIYEANRRYEDSRRIMKMAYRRSSSSKTVLYRLAELDIVTGNIDEAKKFINEFEQNSPNDTSRFILKYKLLKAENAPIDDTRTTSTRRDGPMSWPDSIRRTARTRSASRNATT